MANLGRSISGGTTRKLVLAALFAALGVFLYLSPVALLICAVSFFAAVALSGYVSVGSLLAAGLMPAVIFIQQGSGSCLYLALFVSLLIWIKHRSNIVRLMRHEEKSWKKKKETTS